MIIWKRDFLKCLKVWNFKKEGVRQDRSWKKPGKGRENFDLLVIPLNAPFVYLQLNDSLELYLLKY